MAPLVEALLHKLQFPILLEHLELHEEKRNSTYIPRFRIKNMKTSYKVCFSNQQRQCDPVFLYCNQFSSLVCREIRKWWWHTRFFPCFEDIISIKHIKSDQSKQLQSYFIHLDIVMIKNYEKMNTRLWNHIKRHVPA